MKRRFDNCCPHCGEQLDDLYADWTGNDYQTEFRVECEHCGKPVAVTVHTVPEFELGPPICPMCNAELSLDDRHYCRPCAARMRELSEYNKTKRAP